VYSRVGPDLGPGFMESAEQAGRRQEVSTPSPTCPDRTRGGQVTRDRGPDRMIQKRPGLRRSFVVLPPSNGVQNQLAGLRFWRRSGDDVALLVVGVVFHPSTAPGGDDKGRNCARIERRRRRRRWGQRQRRRDELRRRVRRSTAAIAAGRQPPLDVSIESSEVGPSGLGPSAASRPVIFRRI
jgi:hypothetical protein